MPYSPNLFGNYKTTPDYKQ
uniref:Uncharacterized protein n=1 Tax=Rhizophora mucronata TaxID=61149 RepID=A0A2P2QCP7_RHIMU